MIRLLLIAQLQVSRQLNHGIAPIARVSRHIIQNRAINMMRFGRIWRDPRTHLTIGACPPLAPIAKDFQRAVADAASVRDLLRQAPPRLKETALLNVVIGTGAALLPRGVEPSVGALH